ncbi:MAG: MsnO8 family LLM class oxidoreductase, partial [Propionibacterium sp.]|nr:MsnO8 family LLM class oxidoreductase [Propionibacterium sp.]
MTRPPLSALELATVNVDQTTADALADSIEVAQVAEELGFTRLWVAEHHNMGSVGSTNPPVLIAAIAARTERIRVGSGGVMLPNHAPYVVAEQFALLEALHPGRIDLGLGRAPGTDQFTARALRRTGHDDVDQFPNHVLQLMSWLGDNRLTEPLSDRLSVTP